ncbi:M16 family metallopeptidase [Zunongwangia atlantica]|nr:insulinase family protein [Zunongwangia atlantica]
MKHLDDKPAGIQLSLIVKVGNDQEKKGQSEFAHIIEHLGFTAAKDPVNGITESLYKKLDINIGQINGHTKNEYTEYRILLKNGQEEKLGVLMNYIHNMIWNLNIDNTNLDVERKAVINEANSGNFGLPLLPLSMEREITGWGTPIPSDYLEHMQRFTLKEVTEFYRLWYRTDKMALMVIGDIPDMDEVENKIKSNFNKLLFDREVMGDSLNKRAYLNRLPQFIKKDIAQPVNQRPDPTVKLNLYYRMNPSEIKITGSSLTDRYIRELFVRLLNERYQQQLKHYNKFYFIRSQFLDPPYALRLNISINEQFGQGVIEDLLSVVAQVRNYGFLPEEFNKVQKETLASANKDTTKISFWRNKFLSNYMEKEALEIDHIKLIQEFSENLTFQEFNEMIQEFLKSEPDDISLAAVEGNSALQTSEDQVRNWIQEINTKEVTPYNYPVTPQYLISPKRLEHLNGKGMTKLKTLIPRAEKYRLDNGLVMLLKPQKDSSKRGAIKFHGFSNSSKLQLEEDEYAGHFLSQVLKNSGLGELDKFQLERFLNDINFRGNVDVYTNLQEVGINGKTSKKDLEIALQLVYSYFNSPNFSMQSFQDWKKRKELEPQSYVERYDEFMSEIRKVLPDDNFLPEGDQKLRNIETIELEQVKRIHKKLFGNPGDFTFLFSGDFDSEDILQLLNKYLGNLLAFDSNKRSKDVPYMNQNTSNPSSYKYDFYSDRIEDAVMVRIAYATPTDAIAMDWRAKIKLEFLRRITSQLMMDKLRFKSDEGGIYQVSVGTDYVEAPKRLEIFTQYDCLAEDADRLIRQTKDIVRNLGHMITPEIFERYRKSMLTSNGNNTTGKILDYLYDYQNQRNEWVTNKERRKYIENLDIDDLRESIHLFLNDKQVPYEFKMLPKA